MAMATFMSLPQLAREASVPVLVLNITLLILIPLGFSPLYNRILLHHSTAGVSPTSLLLQLLAALGLFTVNLSLSTSAINTCSHTHSAWKCYRYISFLPSTGIHLLMMVGLWTLFILLPPERQRANKFFKGLFVFLCLVIFFGIGLGLALDSRSKIDAGAFISFVSLATAACAVLQPLPQAWMTIRWGTVGALSLRSVGMQIVVFLALMLSSGLQDGWKWESWQGWDRLWRNTGYIRQAWVVYAALAVGQAVVFILGVFFEGRRKRERWEAERQIREDEREQERLLRGQQRRRFYGSSGSG